MVRIGLGLVPDPQPPRRANDSKGTLSSTGRGGAGNFGPKSESCESLDLTTPFITTPIYTSGRGGTGNMQRNDPNHPEYARSSQDVELPPVRPSSSEYHGVRGGAGNVFTPSEDELMDAREYEERIKYDRTVQVDHSRIDYRGWADKGKDFLLKRRK